jgi:hypothetical protein
MIFCYFVMHSFFAESLKLNVSYDDLLPDHPTTQANVA